MYRRSLRFCAIALGLTFVSGIGLGQTMMNFTADRGATIFSRDLTLMTDRAMGAGAELFAGQTGVAASNTIRRALIHFNISAIPPGSMIQTAQLTMTRTRGGGASAGTSVTLHLLSQDWGEGGSTATNGPGALPGVPSAAQVPDATWSFNMFNTSSWMTAGGTFVAGSSASAMPAGATTWSSPQMASDVQQWLDMPMTNFGWLVMGAESTASSVHVFSSDDGGNPPTLNVTFLTPADLTITKTDSMDPVLPSSALSYTVTVSNGGDQDANTITVTDTLPGGVSGVTASGTGWTCMVALPTVTCTRASVAANSSAPDITIDLTTPAATGTITNNVSVTTASTESDTMNNSASEDTVVAAGADVGVTKMVSPSPVEVGGTVTFTLNAVNNGPQTATMATVVDNLPAGLTGVMASGTGWNCMVAVPTVLCDRATMGVGTFPITITATVPTTVGTLTNQTNIAAVENDPTPGNDSDSVNFDVVSPAQLSATKAVAAAAGSFAPGEAIIYTITITNNGTQAQLDNAGDEFTDTLPAALTGVSAMVVMGGGTVNVAGNTVTWNGSIPSGGQVVIQIDATVDAATSVGATVSNQGTVNFDADGNGSNESSAQTDDPATGAATDPTVFIARPPINIPTASELGLLALALLVLTAALLTMRRQRFSR